MITPSPPEYAYFQVERPIIEGGKSFLAQARAVGQRILGNDLEHMTSVTTYGIHLPREWGVDPDELDTNPLQEPTYRVEPIVEPRMEVCSPGDLVMVVAHRGVPPEHATIAGIGRTMAQLSAVNTYSYETVTGEDGNSRRARVHHPSLREELDQISHKHALTPNQTRVSCRIDLLGEPGEDNVLGLVPDPKSKAAKVLREQARAVQNRLLQEGSRLAFPVTMEQVASPFARFPGDVTDLEYERVLEGMQQLTPVSLVMGAPGVHGNVRPPSGY